jgi:hypothetical protein
MNTKYIIGDLLDSFLTNGGEAKVKAQVVNSRRNEVSVEDATYRAKHVILAAGSGTRALCELKVKVVRSPLLVVKPALTDVNFIKMHPIISQTLNHLYHNTGKGDYSLIGNARYYEPDGDLDEAALQRDLVAMVGKVFRRRLKLENTALYFGYKSELVGEKQLRNYQYHIIETDHGTVTLPGKMTLAFSLAVNVCKYFGIDPSSALPPLQPQCSPDLVGSAVHYEKFLSLP